jgi:hypothetical protein
MHSNNLLWQKALPTIKSRLDHGNTTVREQNARKTKLAYAKIKGTTDKRQHREGQELEELDGEEDQKSLGELKEEAENRQLHREYLERRAQQQHEAEEAEKAYKLTERFAREVEEEREIRYAYMSEMAMTPAQKATRVSQNDTA